MFRFFFLYVFLSLCFNFLKIQTCTPGYHRHAFVSSRNEFLSNGFCVLNLLKITNSIAMRDKSIENRKLLIDNLLCFSLKSGEWINSSFAICRLNSINGFAERAHHMDGYTFAYIWAYCVELKNGWERKSLQLERLMRVICILLSCILSYPRGILSFIAV